MCVFQFLAFITDFLMKRFKYKYIDAKDLVSLIPLIFIFLIPIMSAIAQPLGKKPIFWIVSSLLAIGCFQTMEQLDPEPSHKVTIAIVLFAVFYALYISVVFSCVALVVPKQGV